MYFCLFLMLSTVALVSGDIFEHRHEDTCLCLIGDGVDARDNAGVDSNVVAYVKIGDCFSYAGKNETRNGHLWYLVKHHRQVVWIEGVYLKESSKYHCCDGYVCDEEIFVKREDWGAANQKGPMVTLKTPVDMIIIHQVKGSSNLCVNPSSCEKELSLIQNHQMYTLDSNDVKYNFMVGGDGKVYVGRGWKSVGAHTVGYDSRSLGFAVIGHFADRYPPKKALDAIRSAIQCGIEKGFISRDYKLYGHKDVADTTCPGDKLHEFIKKWPHFSTETPTKEQV